MATAAVIADTSVPPPAPVTPAVSAPAPHLGAGPERRRWTAGEFQRMSDAGVFGPEERLELIEGEVVRKVTQNAPHWTAIRKTQRLLESLFATGFDIRTQVPLNFGEGAGDRPEPDVAVVTGSFQDYATAHPTTAVLVVEVSDVTLAFDRSTKAQVYARAGIAEYWVVNLIDHVLEVHRQPVASAASPTGHEYGSVLRLRPDESVTPLAAPAGSSAVSVSGLLP